MKCYFCDHNVNAGGAAQHLRKHKVILKEFIKTPEGEEWYVEYKKESNEIFKSRSPFSPDFKGCDDNNDEVRKNRVKVMIEKRESNRQNKIIQEKELYGNDYDDIINERNRLRSIKTKETSIKKLCKKYNVDEDKAYELYCIQRKIMSPRSKEYWLANLNTLSNDINSILAILSQYNSYKIDRNRKKNEYIKAVLFFTELNATYVKDIEKDLISIT